MKSLLMYNYDLKNPSIYNVNNRIYIKDNNEIYLLEEVNKKDLYYYISRIDKSYNPIINKKDNDIFFFYKDRKYILEHINSKKISLEEIIIDYKNKIIVKKNNWKELWIKKIDKIEKINADNQEIKELNNYYIGMAETAVSFLNNNKDKIEEKENSICRIRIDDINYRSNDNLIIDCKERDYAEYIKYLFFSNKKKEILIFLNRLDLKKYNKYLIFARLLFPTYYFDIVENIIINNNNQKKYIENIKNRIEEYEEQLSTIYNSLFTDNDIKWLNKK